LALPLTPPPRDPSRAACPSTAAHADAWLDGELSPGASAALEAHVRGCGACRTHVDARRRLAAALRRQRAHEPPAPASLRARVRELAARWHEAEARADAVCAAAAAGAPPAHAAPDVSAADGAGRPAHAPAGGAPAGGAPAGTPAVVLAEASPAA
jgi:anti-sigma factor RsiW